MKSIITSQILKALNINRNTFQDWLDRGLVFPSVQKSSKQGEANLFSIEDVYRIELFRRLLSLGLTRSLARDVLRELTFENVGSKPRQIKFAILSRGLVPQDDEIPPDNVGIREDQFMLSPKRPMKFFKLKLCERIPKIDFHPEEDFAIVFGLLSVKQYIDTLFAE